jgi:predicted nuclease of predicted toxin-antitoxin system
MMEILVDETSDGWDIKLKLLGYEAKSVKKLKETEKKLGHDFNIIQYAQQNKMLLITKDKECGKACKANNFPCIWISDDSIIEKMILPELENLKSKNYEN